MVELWGVLNRRAEISPFSYRKRRMILHRKSDRSVCLSLSLSVPPSRTYSRYNYNTAVYYSAITQSTVGSFRTRINARQWLSWQASRSEIRLLEFDSFLPISFIFLFFLFSNFFNAAVHVTDGLIMYNYATAVVSITSTL